MGRPRKDTSAIVPTRQRLTLAQLAAYDDILTDALVDHVSSTGGLLAHLLDSIDLVRIGSLLDNDTQESVNVPSVPWCARGGDCQDCAR